MADEAAGPEGYASPTGAADAPPSPRSSVRPAASKSKAVSKGKASSRSRSASSPAKRAVDATAVGSDLMPPKATARRARPPKARGTSKEGDAPGDMVPMAAPEPQQKMPVDPPTAAVLNAVVSPKRAVAMPVEPTQAATWSTVAAAKSAVLGTVGTSTEVDSLSTRMAARRRQRQQRRGTGADLQVQAASSAPAAPARHDPQVAAELRAMRAERERRSAKLLADLEALTAGSRSGASPAALADALDSARGTAATSAVGDASQRLARSYCNRVQARPCLLPAPRALPGEAREPAAPQPAAPQLAAPQPAAPQPAAPDSQPATMAEVATRMAEVRGDRDGDRDDDREREDAQACDGASVLRLPVARSAAQSFLPSASVGMMARMQHAGSSTAAAAAPPSCTTLATWSHQGAQVHTTPGVQSSTMAVECSVIGGRAGHLGADEPAEALGQARAYWQGRSAAGASVSHEALLSGCTAMMAVGGRQADAQGEEVDLVLDLDRHETRHKLRQWLAAENRVRAQGVPYHIGSYQPTPTPTISTVGCT